MYFDWFYGVPKLTPGTADAGAREHNACPPLSEAWRYPTRAPDELEDEIRQIMGQDATVEKSLGMLRFSRVSRKFEESCVAVRVAVARCDAGAPTRWARELAALDTRVHFTTVAPNDDGSTRFEAFVWVANPHNHAAPFVNRRELRWESGAEAASGSCRCGAKHVGFYWARKSSNGDDLENVSFQCLACGRATLTLDGVNRSHGVEVYLVDGVPLDRVSRLRRTDAWRDLPLARRVAAEALSVLRALAGPALFLAAAFLLLRGGCR